MCSAVTKSNTWTLLHLNRLLKPNMNYGMSFYLLLLFFACSVPELIAYSSISCCKSSGEIAEDMARVFVYGTLKRGQPNYSRMLDAANGKAKLLASACTAQKHPLVIAGMYNVPFLLNVPGQGHRVKGEIYKVDEKMLKFLDEFESVPTMYQRTEVKLEVEEWVGEEEKEKMAPGSITEAFVYSTTSYEADWLSLRRYESYDSKGDHGLEYHVREARD